jgi:hypothetical protein
MQHQGEMKMFLPKTLLLALVALPLAACSTAQKTALRGGAQVGGDTFTGTVIESTPDRITIKIKDQPKLLVLEGDAEPALAQR